jgi:hypothetical protein
VFPELLSTTVSRGQPNITEADTGKALFYNNILVTCLLADMVAEVSI